MFSHQGKLYYCTKRFFVNMRNDAKKNALRAFFNDTLKGIGIGAAFIIPGFSGGSVAAVLGIYEKLVGAIADIFKNFKSSVKTLLPIAIGMVFGILALIFPLKWALSQFPFPTVSLFVGLAIGGLPSITTKTRGEFKISSFIACFIPLLFALCLSFLPSASDVNLFELDILGYFLLFIIGIIGSTALVIPGISGSMILLILGYYNPILKLATEHLLMGRDVATSILVLSCVALGIAVGFFFISVIMKILLIKYPRGTHFAILGFIIGSVPTIYISTAKDASITLDTLPKSPIYWVASILMLAGGVLLSYLLVKYSAKLKSQKQI